MGFSWLWQAETRGSLLTLRGNMLLLTLAAIAATASARPHYIALPADQIAFMDLSSLHVRRPRQTFQPLPQLPQNLTPPPQPPQGLYPIEYEYQPAQQEFIPIQEYLPQQIQLAPQPPPEPAPVTQEEPQAPQSQDASSAASQLDSRPPDFGEYVDFGAHTGDNGAFGWYADYPVNNREDHEDTFKK